MSSGDMTVHSPFDTRTYIHPHALETVLPFLKNHLPSAIAVEFVVRNPPSPTVFVLASYAPSEHPPSSAPWSVSVVDLSKLKETGLWFWSSVEELADADDDTQAKAFRAGCGHLQSFLTFVAITYPDAKNITVGSLHTSFSPYIPAASIEYLSENWAKLIFSTSTLPDRSPESAGNLAKYTFRKMDPVHLGDAVALSSVPRTVETLARHPSTGAYLSASPDEPPHAWCFISNEGSVGSLYVRPENRGNGLGKEAMRQELEKGFMSRRFLSAEVGLGNVASLAVCGSLGARKQWEVVWVTFKLQYFRTVV